MNKNTNYDERIKPIGVFDSGLGGLTVASAISKILPYEKIIYFGDTAHLPYGDKSRETITRYSTQITELLLSMNCKIIVIACNTISSVAIDEINKHVGNKAIVVNVIDPIINHIKDKTLNTVGVIGTKATINSGTYARKILENRPDIDVISLATPLLVPMIEEGFIYDDISNAVIRSYLSNQKLKNIDSLILGCTHYPIIKNQIRKYYDFTINVIDSSEATASAVKDILTENELLYPEHRRQQNTFFISDYTETFDKIAKMFFDNEIQISKLDLWHISHKNKEEIVDKIIQMK